MRFLLLALTAALAVSLSTAAPSPSQGPRFYIRHRRAATEREDTPAKESTVVVATDSKSDASASTDLPDDLKTTVKENDKDCKDFFEMDYNPRRDTFMFNGQIPNFFHPFGPMANGSAGGDPGMQNIQHMFHQMFQQAHQMFNRFPMHPGAEIDGKQYPDNYNGTTEDIVDIDGEKFVKKTKIINKVIDGVHVHIMSTTLVKKEDADKEAGKGGDKEPAASEAEGKLPGGEEKKVKIPASSDDDEEETPKNRSPNAEELTTKKPNDLTDGKVVSY